MDALNLARWQFGVTAAYHFLFVPLSIGLVFLLAVIQTLHYRTGKEEYLRLTRFFRKLFLRPERYRSDPHRRLGASPRRDARLQLPPWCRSPGPDQPAGPNLPDHA